MEKFSYKEIKKSLSKWQDICKLMDNEEDREIVNQVLEVLNVHYNNEEKVDKDNKREEVKKKKNVAKKSDNTEKVISILKDINDGNESVISKNKFSFIDINVNIQEEWGKLSQAKKKKLTNLELNIIYDLLYKPSNIKYIKKNKEELIRDIEYFIKDKKRDKSIKESSLI